MGAQKWEEITVVRCWIVVMTPSDISLLSAGVSGQGYKVARNPWEIFLTRVLSWSPWKKMMRRVLSYFVSCLPPIIKLSKIRFLKLKKSLTVEGSSSVCQYAVDEGRRSLDMLSIEVAQTQAASHGEWRQLRNCQKIVRMDLTHKLRFWLSEAQFPPPIVYLLNYWTETKLWNCVGLDLKWRINSSWNCDDADIPKLSGCLAWSNSTRKWLNLAQLTQIQEVAFNWMWILVDFSDLILQFLKSGLRELKMN